MLQDHLRASAEDTPDRVAIVAGSDTLSFRELDEASNRVARGLMAKGVQRGDRVAICLDNRLETVVAIYATLKAGAAFVMINPVTKPAKLQFLLGNSRARALVLRAAALDALGPSLASLSDLEVVVAVGESPSGALDGQVVPWATLHEDQSADRLPARGIDLDLAALLYTSGSTGEAKGVMLTHLNITSATQSIGAYLRLCREDVILNVLPLSFGYGLTQLFPAVMVRARLVLEKGMAYPHVTLTQMVKHGATGLALVPTLATTLLGLDLAKYDLSKLRYITNAGAGIPPELIGRLRRSLPHVQLYPMYGQTECLRVTYLDPGDVDARPDSVGRGMPNQELMIVDTDGRPVGPGVVGELVVRGAHVMAGYWERPEETARSLRPGRLPGERVLFTGDLFRCDEEGYFYFVARQDDIIKSRGEKVSPREVENVLYTIPGVLEAVVVGVPDPLLGQAVKAYVVLAPGVTLDAHEVKRRCAMRLEDFMVPTAVEFLSELPKNERGKIAKRELVSAGSSS